MFKKKAKALGWLAALLAMDGGGAVLKPRGGGGVSSIAKQRQLQVPPLGPNHHVTPGQSLQQSSYVLQAMVTLGTLQHVLSKQRKSAGARPGVESP